MPVTRFRTYFQIYERYAALIFLIIALTLPRISAVLVEFIPGVETVIICTGSEYISVTLGPDGEPLYTEEIGEAHCTLSDVAQVDQAESPYWHILAASFHKAFSIKENWQLATLNFSPHAPTRAPPTSI